MRYLDAERLDLTVELDPRELARALSRELDGGVRVDAYTRHVYSRDASMYAIEPLAVAFPRHAEDVVSAVAVAREYRVPVLPRGAGTSLAGQTVGRAVVLDLSRHLTRIEELDPDARSARVQPGVVQDHLNRAASAHGLMFGPDTSTSDRATLGGMIGNNSAGTSSGLYGMTIDHVQSVDVVLADASTCRFEPIARAERRRASAAGSLEHSIYDGLDAIVEAHRELILRDSPPFWRHAGGYRLDRLARQDAHVDLTPLIVGSEGTLAIVTEARVGLVPRPAGQATVVGHFRSTADAIAATQDALELGAAAIELIDRTILDLSRSRLEYAALGRILVDDPDALLFVTFHGECAAEAEAAVEHLSATWAKHGHGYHALVAVGANQAALLKVRKASLGLLMAASTGSRRPLAFVEDTAVPPDRLVDYVAAFREILDRHGLRAGIYGHCSVGCLHIRPFVDLRIPGEVAVMKAVADEVLELVLAFGGVNSSEHGDGLVRSEFNRRVFGAELYALMREVKHLFDPEGLFNPGKIVDAESLTSNLRDSALPPAGPLVTQLQFVGTDGMRGAADRCMNIGVCRKTTAGVMCPSYMATRDEEHSTRGRANALVKALSTPDPKTALGDDRLHEIMDLCLECKACKSECPLGVDMAALKSEFLAQFYATHKVPLRSRLFASVRLLNRVGSATAPISNLPGGFRPLRSALDSTLGIARERPLPRFERDSLVRWYGRRPLPCAATRGELVFLADSFTTFTEPAIGRAAIELLERAGWRVRLESSGCCGRASISKGLLARARAQAAAMLDRLEPYAARGVPIVGCEPSCILTLCDEYPALLPDDARVPVVASQVRPLSDVISQAIDDGSLAFGSSQPRHQRILLHVHCHEKALVRAGSAARMLSRIPGVEIVELDAGCCGMAGSFGFESEHYDLSMQIGGLRLFPALAAEADDVLVAATGVSCRQQIAHGANRIARHPVELVRDALGGDRE